MSTKSAPESIMSRKSARLIFRRRRKTLLEKSSVLHPINMPRTVECFNGSKEEINSSENRKTLFMAGLNLYRKPDFRGVEFQRRLLLDECEMYKKSHENILFSLEGISSSENTQLDWIYSEEDSSSEKAYSFSLSDSDSSSGTINNLSLSDNDTNSAKLVSPSTDTLDNKPINFENKFQCKNEPTNWDINMVVSITSIGSTNKDEFSNISSTKSNNQLKFSTNNRVASVCTNKTSGCCAPDEEEEGWQSFDTYMKSKLAQNNKTVKSSCRVEIIEAKAKLAKLAKEWVIWSGDN